MDDVTKTMPNIYVALDERQLDHQSNIVKVEG